MLAATRLTLDFAREATRAGLPYMETYSFTVSMPSPNGRQLPAAWAVQGDRESVYGFPYLETCLFPVGADWSELSTHENGLGNSTKTLPHFDGQKHVRNDFWNLIGRYSIK